MAFEGIITSDMKSLYKDAIDALLEDDALTRPCTLIYEGTKWEDCPNCDFDPISSKSSGRWTSGGPTEFKPGQVCPYCSGAGRRAEQDNTDAVSLCIIWDNKGWVPMATAPPKIGQMLIQTLSKYADTYDKIKRAKIAILDTAISASKSLQVIRVGEPELLGFGSNDFVITLWERGGHK